MNGNANTRVGRREWQGEPRVLFVEGYSDLTFYAEVLEHLDLHAGSFIQDLGGKGRLKLRDQARLLLKPDNLTAIESVAVVLDSDGKPGPSFDLARDAMRDAVGVDIPRAGEWFGGSDDRTKYGVFIVGDSADIVEVESLAWRSWIGDDRNSQFRQCVEAFSDCARGSGKTLRSADKVRVGTLLSVLNEDDPRLGPGARAGIFPLDAKEFEALRSFLRGMTPPRPAVL
jgi:hypothetical protein